MQNTNLRYCVVPRADRRTIVHPKDASTAFLRPCYDQLPQVDLQDGAEPLSLAGLGAGPAALFMGHGSPSGLFAIGGFGCGAYVIGVSEVEKLRRNAHIYIWCHADKFVSHHQCRGFATGMFISEPAEALLFGFANDPSTAAAIDASNKLFANIVGLALLLGATPEELYTDFMPLYARAADNPIVDYNLQRIKYIG